MHKIPWRFLCKSLHLGDYRGHINLAYPGTIPGAVNTLGGGSGLPGGRSADRRGRRSRRQILHRRQAVGVGGSDGGGSDGGGVSAWRADGRQVGGQLRQSAGRPAIRQRCQSGRRRRYQTRRPAQRYHAAQARRRSIARAIRRQSGQLSASPTGQQAAGRRRYQTPAPAKIPRRAGPREVLAARRSSFAGSEAQNFCRYEVKKSLPGSRGRKSWRGQKCDRGRKRGGFGQKKKPPMRRLMARTAGGCNMERAGARVCARSYGLRRGRRR